MPAAKAFRVLSERCDAQLQRVIIIIIIIIEHDYDSENDYEHVREVRVSSWIKKQACTQKTFTDAFHDRSSCPIISSRGFEGAISLQVRRLVHVSNHEDRGTKTPEVNR